MINSVYLLELAEQIKRLHVSSMVFDEQGECGRDSCSCHYHINRLERESVLLVVCCNTGGR